MRVLELGCREEGRGGGGGGGEVGEEGRGGGMLAVIIYLMQKFEV